MKKKLLSLALTLALSVGLLVQPAPALAAPAGQIRSTGAGTITYNGNTGGAIKPDGTLWTWGGGTIGMLGTKEPIQINT